MSVSEVPNEREGGSETGVFQPFLAFPRMALALRGFPTSVIPPARTRQKGRLMGRFADHPMAAWCLGAIALLIAALGAKPYAGSWNDGSRLAAVESLLDRGTLAIDDSAFCKTPQHLLDSGHLPYSPDRADLLEYGTYDKLFVRGHFHSDKPAVVSILMAGMYRPLMWLGVPSPGERPDIFCYLMTLLTSGLSYAVAVGCLWTLGRQVGLEPRWRLLWLAAFALSTYAPTYTQHVNSHAMQLGIVALMCVLLNREAASGQMFALGTLAGLGFNLDFGSGPPLVAFTFAFVLWQTRRFRSVLAFSSAVLPWVIAGIGINYAIGGVWKPINMYPEHFQFPGTPFTGENLTGFFRHEPLNQFLYAAGMLFGKQGFLNHNMPLLLCVVAGWSVLRGSKTPHPQPLSPAGRGEESCAGLLMLLIWCGATWLMYAVLSNNMGGGCCSVRWFVPFLAPGFWLLALILRDRPERRSEFLVLAVGGAVLASLMWWKGPWTMRMVPFLWPIVGVTLIAWGVVAASRRRTPSQTQILVPLRRSLAA